MGQRLTAAAFTRYAPVLLAAGRASTPNALILLAYLANRAHDHHADEAPSCPASCSCNHEYPPRVHLDNDALAAALGRVVDRESPPKERRAAHKAVNDAVRKLIDVGAVTRQTAQRPGKAHRNDLILTGLVGSWSRWAADRAAHVQRARAAVDNSQ